MTVIRRMRSCRQRLRSTSRAKATGTPSVAAVRKAAVPGSVTGGCEARRARNTSSGWRRVSRTASSTRLPVIQVSIRKATAKASSSGNQPPSNSFTLLAAKKIRSMTRKKPLTANTATGL